MAGLMPTYRLRRTEREIVDRSELDAVLRRGRYMAMAMCRDGEPYVVTLSYGYGAEENGLYCHCARDGLKLEFLGVNPNVCATMVEDLGYRRGLPPAAGVLILPPTRGEIVSILIHKNTQVLVQGITGDEGAFHTRQMVAYGTKVVAGVTPGKGGETLDGIPVYDSVAEAAEAHQLDASVLFVPAAFAPDALLEAAAAGIPLLVCITEGIPLHAMLRAYHLLQAYPVRLIGPNCPGIISPGKAKVGVIPGAGFTPGPVGIVSRSGTLTYEIAHHLSQSGIGQSTVVGIGGDPVIGSSFTDILPLFEEDPDTEIVVLAGEIGGSAEEEAAVYLTEHGTKPVVAYIAGFSAPPGKRMGHAGAIVMGSEGTAQAKAKRLENAGIAVARTPAEVSRLVKERLG